MSMIEITCLICNTPRKIKPSEKGRVTTCGAKKCIAERTSRQVLARGDDWRTKHSEMAKCLGFGLWMTGKKASERAVKLSSERWIGEKNPRWKGGITRKESHQKWMAANPERSRHYGRVRKARRKGAGGSFTLGEWLALKRGYLFTCPSCVKSQPEIKLTVDHIVPIIKHGPNDIANIQPLCGLCNNKKGIKVKKYDSSLIVAKFKSLIVA